MIQVEPITRLLHLSPLHADDWLVAAVTGLAVGSVSAMFAPRPSRGGRSGRRRSLKPA
jgi:hypothetical protein